MESPNSSLNKPLHVGKPAWLKTSFPTGSAYAAIKRDLRDRKLFTVCEEAKCPNIAKCWNDGTATFMVLGDTCTRGCRFCNVKTGNPNGWLDKEEPSNVAQSVLRMNLNYVVITMVDRDDLADGGAEHVRDVLNTVREQNPKIVMEVLAGDFRGNTQNLATVLESRPEVYSHNIETIERLSPRVRDARAQYRTSLKMLAEVKRMSEYPVFTKSAMMLGLGEEIEDVKRSLEDLREHGVEFVAIGQYLRPTKKHLAIKRFVTPVEFQILGDYAKQIGFRSVASGPLVRSSFLAHEYFKMAINNK
jgi:lipoic acid synthetase